MGYMTFEQQIALHLQFLQQAGLEVTDLIIDSPKFICCHANSGEKRARCAYKTVSRQLNNKVGLMTWCRSRGGKINTYKTYGHAFRKEDKEEKIPGEIPSRMECRSIIEDRKRSEVDMKKIQRFWELSSTHGESDYLKRKGVNSYRIRFRENKYGKVAVIPMRDIRGQLQGYQILNADGSKAFAKGIQITGLFHQLTDLIDIIPIGIAEGYVTAATCFELLPMPMVTAFTSENLEHVAAALRERYPNSPLVIFADNDRHLSKNKGMISAAKALEKAKGNGIILAPRFRNCLKVKDYSDWNDLVREIGPVKASEQLWEEMQQTQDDRIKTFYI
jgi:phage/plasmid primase-like uncharacterized protein